MRKANWVLGCLALGSLPLVGCSAVFGMEEGELGDPFGGDDGGAGSAGTSGAGGTGGSAGGPGGNAGAGTGGTGGSAGGPGGNAGAAGKGGSSGTCGAPSVSGVTPLVAYLDTLATFTVAGECLPSTVAFFVENCSGVAQVAVSATEAVFTCTPSDFDGAQQGVVKDKPGGTELMSFEVDFRSCAPSVSSVEPLTAYLDLPATFTVHGTCLGPTLLPAIEDCDGMSVASVSDTAATFSCTPRQYAGAHAGTIHDTAGGTELYAFALDVAQAPCVLESSANACPGTTAASYSCALGVPFAAWASVDSGGEVTVFGYQPAGFQDGDYAVKVFDPAVSASLKCAASNVTKATLKVSGSPEVITFPSFASLLGCGDSPKGYCFARMNSMGDPVACSGELQLTAASGYPVEPPDPACECIPGQKRCAGAAQAQVEVCDPVTAKWVSAAACTGGQLCDNADATCKPPVSVCMGQQPAAFVCDGAIRHQCGPDLVTSETADCGTVAHCGHAQGLTCAVCDAGEHRCVGANLEVCASDYLTFDGLAACETAALCNAGAGQCEAATCVAGQYQCTAESALELCNVDQTGFDLVANCDAGMCDLAGAECDICMPNALSCADMNTKQTCDGEGQAQAPEVCGAPTPYCVDFGVCVQCRDDNDCTGQECEIAGCSGGVCGVIPKDPGTPCAGTGYCNGQGGCGVCIPGTKRCTGYNELELCSAIGAWATETACGDGTQTCALSGCVPQPSCDGLAVQCRDAGALVSCCDAKVVPGGTFPMGRSFDGTDKCPSAMSCGADEQPEHPATVDGFLMDTFEVTVGRFRKFVAQYDAWRAAGNPVPDAGAHPLIEGSGWQSGWAAGVPSSAATLAAGLKCDPGKQTWTDTAGANEAYGINCVNWYEAFAFCAWDGGRLPTEAEWEYAAAGGAQNRLYPWGQQAANPSLVNYLSGDDTPLVVVGTHSAGAGRWGNHDLSGNMWEWVLDWNGAYTTSACPNCANLTPASHKLSRGGAWDHAADGLRAADRVIAGAAARSNNGGFRCVRSAPPCTHGERRCSGDTPVACVNGTWESESRCGTVEECVDGQCAGIISSKLLFHVRSGSTVGIHTMYPSGGGRQKLATPTSGVPAGNTGNGRWSPNLQKIAFNSFHDYNSEVYIMNADGSAITKLTSDGTYSGTQYPVFPNDQKIWYARGLSEIWEMNIDGSGKVQKSSFGGTGRPWSLDMSATEILYINNVSYNYNVVIANLDFTGQKQCTTSAGNWLPRFSPDGRRVVWGGSTSASSWYGDVWVMNSDCSNQLQLTTSQDAVMPVWSPDGTRIALLRGSGGLYHIWVMRGDGSDPVQITTTAEDFWLSDWRATP